MFKKKIAQAATEFILTYGWALLIITTVIGVFVYIQVTPQQIVTPSCMFTDGLYCQSHQVTSDTIKMEIKNNVGRDININRTVCTIHQETFYEDESVDIKIGESKIIECYIEDADVGVDELVQANVIIYYVVDGQTYPRTVEGNVIGYTIE